MESTANKSPLRTCFDRLIALGFVAAICIPLAGFLYRGEESESLGENRPLATLRVPTEARDWIEVFPDTFDDYFRDHFGFRRQLIRLYSRAALELMNESPSPDVAIGKEGWLFFLGSDTLADLKGKRLYPEQELDQWRRYLEGRQAWLAERGIAYLYVMPPAKSSIYPEYMPGFMQSRRGQTRASQLIDYLREHSTVQILDLREPLLRAKPGMDALYYRTDTHWNDLGAFVAYTAIINELSAIFEGLKPHPLIHFERVGEETEYRGDLLKLMAEGSEAFVETEVALAIKDRKLRHAIDPVANSEPASAHLLEEFDATAPSALLLGDSFMAALRPFLALHFSVRRWDINRHADKILEIDEWEPDERPAIVIEEKMERYMSAPAVDPEFEEALERSRRKNAPKFHESRQSAGERGAWSS